MSDAVPLGERLRFGTMVSTSSREEATRGLESIARWGYEVLWAPDHVAFTGPVNDPLTTLAYLSALEPKLTFGTSVYLLPLRHPVPVAKMVATLDRLLGAGHFIFGVGVGGEFPREYEACGVPIHERGGRATEAIQVMKRLWSGERVEHRGKYFSFGEISMQPRPKTPGGPPIWIGGRAEGPLKRAARYGDGWMPYVVTPKRFADGLDFIGKEAERAGRDADVVRHLHPDILQARRQRRSGARSRGQISKQALRDRHDRCGETLRRTGPSGGHGSEGERVHQGGRARHRNRRDHASVGAQRAARAIRQRSDPAAEPLSAANEI